VLLSLCYVLVRRVLQVAVWRWRFEAVKALEVGTNWRFCAGRLSVRH